MKFLTATVFSLLAASALFAAPRLGTVTYNAIEVDPFVPDRNVDFPADYQAALVDDIARETSLLFKTVIILRQGQQPPDRYRVLRITGTITRFKPGSRGKRLFIGFGAGATVIDAEVEFADASTAQVLLYREMRGVTWTGVAGGDSKGAGESLARKIAKLCDEARLIASY